MAHVWYKKWKDDRVADTWLIKWEGFVIVFLDWFCTTWFKGSQGEIIQKPKQGNIDMKEFSLKITQLKKYALAIVADSRSEWVSFC